nr:hypothetical protein 1 [ssRNA positive-strand virus sp.]
MFINSLIMFVFFFIILLLNIPDSENYSMGFPTRYKINKDKSYYYDDGGRSSQFKYGKAMDESRIKMNSMEIHYSDFYVLNYVRDKLLTHKNKTKVYVFNAYKLRNNLNRFKLQLFKYLDTVCTVAYFGNKCDLPSHCINTKLMKIDDNITLCYGHLVDNQDWKIVDLDFYIDQLNSEYVNGFKIYPKFDINYHWKAYIDIYYPSSLFDLKTLSNINVTNKKFYLELEYNDFDYFLDLFTHNPIGFIPVEYEYKYVCDDALYEEAKMIDNIYIFPSRRNDCRKHIRYNFTHFFCYDTIFSSYERCPSDYFTTYYYSYADFYIKNKIPIRNKTLDVFDYIDYTIKNYFLGIKSEYNVRTWFEFYFKKWEDLFDYKSVIDYLFHKNNQNIDYFISKLANRTSYNDTTEHLYGNWISDIFGVLIRPFVEAFLSILKEFWEFLRDPIIEILNIFLDIIIELIFDFEKLLTKLLDAIEPKLIEIIDLLLKLVEIIKKFLVSIFVAIENKYYVSEYIILLIIIIYFMHNTTASLLTLVLIILIFGIKRKFCSLLLTFLHSDFDIDNSKLYICILNFTYNTNETHQWFNFNQLEQFIDYLLQNTTDMMLLN